MVDEKDEVLEVITDVDAVPVTVLDEVSNHKGDDDE